MNIYEYLFAFEPGEAIAVLIITIAVTFVVHSIAYWLKNFYQF
jgi:hypothetical protein